uniref:Fe2OG dioxygenase domain-containing protein n=1 Tax=Kalanchoe fedtschenkoi TaxID=63787 RepID=A0A7N0UEK7_KALFE
MVLVKDHGIEVERVRGAVRGFFELPFERKRATVGTLVSSDNMGYGRNFVKSGEQQLDWIDRITMKAAPPEAVDDRAWPKSPPNFREAMERYVEQARTLLDELLQRLAEALGLETDAFIRYYHPQKSEINVRVNYYPPCPAPESVLGISPHSDSSGLTLLLESEASGGLQVMTRAREWVTVPWPRDALLVIAGDLLEIMSSGRILSPWHRAVPLRDTERFSVALFYNPPGDAEIEPVQELGDKYTKIVVRDYLRNYCEVSPAEDKQAIMYAKAR